MGHKHKNLIGKRFGSLLVTDLNGSKNGKRYWVAKCDCGKKAIVRGDRLTGGITKSCGCLAKKNIESNFKKHGMKRSRFYKIWINLKSRCMNKHNKDFKNYGEKGIEVCERWLDFNSFKSDMYDTYLHHIKKYGESDTTIDRIDPDGNYESQNCRWATQLQQQQNRTNNKYVAYTKEKHIL